MLCGAGWGGCGDAALFVRVGFSDDRRLVVLIVLIVVGVSRRQHVVNDGDEAPFDQPTENVLNGQSHVGSSRMSRHSWTNVSSRAPVGKASALLPVTAPTKCKTGNQRTEER